MRVIKAKPPQWMLDRIPKGGHKPSILIPPDPVVINICPLCHNDITNFDRGAREPDLFVYNNVRQLIHKDCAKQKKLGNTTLQEARNRRKKEKKLKERRKY